MLSICWDWKGTVFFELLPRNETINSSAYCRQLDELSNAIRKKRSVQNQWVCKAVVFRHDNSRPQTSLETRQKLLQLCTSSLQNSLRKKKSLISMTMWNDTGPGSIRLPQRNSFDREIRKMVKTNRLKRSMHFPTKLLFDTKKKKSFVSFTWKNLYGFTGQPDTIQTMRISRPSVIGSFVAGYPSK